MTTLEEQRAKADAFRAMHHGPGILVLPNAWDAASARTFAESGFAAIASTSAGIAFSLGLPDGQKISREEMLAHVARIVRAVKVPVSADMEAGYGDRPEDAAKTARGVIEAGAVGLNLEDGTGDPERPLLDLSLQLEKIHAVRETSAAAGVPLVLNARTDVYMGQYADDRYTEALRRLAAFRDAGADCVFVPGLRDAATIRRLVQDVKCPLNILGGPGAPAVRELHALGVARVSTGSGPMRATVALLRRLAEELKNAGTYSTMNDAPAHAELNRLFGNAGGAARA